MASFGTLLQFQETVLRPTAEWSSGLVGYAEIITFVQEGSLSVSESTLEAGGIHCLTVGPSAEFTVKNLSDIENARYCQIWFDTRGTDAVPGSSSSNVEFSKGKVELVPLASGQGETTGVPLQQDVAVYLAKLRPNENLIFETLQSRRVFLVVIDGVVRLEEHRLVTSDSVMIRKESLIEIGAQQASELILADLQ
jgi:redox-sensitive bicupin YhaK (pirin superfamily)